eukprot:CAMPEP_0184505724 /NCGR_PEP_ID=MMETSP0113_2-20130426/53134_1 /TAXON_ID=91329 /ORGANISM="Norrisiella sphaerica, Strain BC52" /LENGTH=47 /DNA_ID= /DNA_START= /DNA_END= /DNA_ORIENTATION=
MPSTKAKFREIMDLTVAGGRQSQFRHLARGIPLMQACFRDSQRLLTV